MAAFPPWEEGAGMMPCLTTARALDWNKGGWTIPTK